MPEESQRRRRAEAPRVVTRHGNDARLNGKRATIGDDHRLGAKRRVDELTSSSHA
jgi:hypothetical protein